ncbi:unnamed protein product [Clonostachys byssicola]|uniref:Uncharacterized protein n=1 Tax=Clonostachys byssicola TaxID=160290 RepID=A0A9N9UEV1_9HYPO|nr:unnamed protein product [Clonostachys byssicola]
MEKDTPKTVSGSVDGQASSKGSTAADQCGMARNGDPSGQDRRHEDLPPSGPILQPENRTKTLSSREHPADSELDQTEVIGGPEKTQPAEEQIVTGLQRLAIATSQDASTKPRANDEAQLMRDSPGKDVTKTVDKTVHHRRPVVHEQIKPQQQTIIQPQLIRSVHFEEHKTFIQPIKDPNPVVLPAQHWMMDSSTGVLHKV